MVGVGIIGCGKRASGIAKRVIDISDQTKVVAVCDPNERSVKDCREHLNVDFSVYDDYNELLRDEAVKWVIIGSWNSLHREHAVAALEAGKDVFCEKPLATTLEDCVAIRDAWRKSGRAFIIGFTLRYSAHYEKIKELIDAGEIGYLISMEFNETLDFNHGGYIMSDWRRLTANAGTHLLEKCCHDVDLVNWIVGSDAARVASFGGVNFFKPENEGFIKKLGKNEAGRDAYRTWGSYVDENPFTSDKDVIDNQVAIIEYANGVRSTFHTNCNAGIRERRMYICGSEGAIRSDVITGEIELRKIGFDTEIQRVDTGAKGGHGGGDNYLAERLVDSMLNGAPPVTTVEDGLKSAITCFGIDQAMESGTVIDMKTLWEKTSG